jgi:hypothetical protein
VGTSLAAYRPDTWVHRQRRPSASKEVSKRRCPWERENRRSDVGQDRSTKDVARANLAAHIDSIARPRPPGRPRAVDWHALSQDARVSVSHTSRGRTSSRLHLATYSRARPPALVVAQPSDAGGCATLISDTGSGRCWAVRGGRARLMAETLVSQHFPACGCRLERRVLGSPFRVPAPLHYVGVRLAD